MQSAVGFGFCAAANLPNSPERTVYFDKAMNSVRQGVEYGYRNWDYLETDLDFGPLQSWPPFQKALKEWRQMPPKK